MRRQIQLEVTGGDIAKGKIQDSTPWEPQFLYGVRNVIAPSFDPPPDRYKYTRNALRWVPRGACTGFVSSDGPICSHQHLRRNMLNSVSGT